MQELVEDPTSCVNGVRCACDAPDMYELCFNDAGEALQLKLPEPGVWARRRNGKLTEKLFGTPYAKNLKTQSRSTPFINEIPLYLITNCSNGYTAA